MRFLESLIGSLGILSVSWLTIPFVGSIAGATVTSSQGFKMGAIFFILRLLWLYAVRVYFSKKVKS